MAGEGSALDIFASAGSRNAGAALRFALGDNLVVSLAAFETHARYDAAGYGGVRMKSATSFGGSLRYMTNPAVLRGFVEAGGWATSKAALEFSRYYMNGAGVATGISTPRGSMSYLYGRAGAVVRVGQTGRLTGLVELGRERLSARGFDESLTSANPFEAHYGASRDRLTLGKVGLAWTQDIGRVFIDASGTFTHAFDLKSDLAVRVPGIGTLPPTLPGHVNWIEYRGAIGYRISPRVSVSLFTTGIAGNRATVGRHAHYGIGLRAKF